MITLSRLSAASASPIGNVSTKIHRIVMWITTHSCPALLKIAFALVLFPIPVPTVPLRPPVLPILILISPLSRQPAFFRASSPVPADRSLTDRIPML